MYERMPDVERRTPIQDGDLGGGEGAGRVAARSQVRLDGVGITLDHPDTSVQPIPVGIAPQVARLALVLAVVGGGRRLQDVRAGAGQLGVVVALRRRQYQAGGLRAEGAVADRAAHGAVLRLRPVLVST
jgi:hypothetical protein